MIANKKVAVIIAAAGSGNRMGGGILKQHIKIDGIPMAIKATRVFLAYEEVDYVVYVSEADTNIKAESFGATEKPLIIVEGGLRRQDSVYRGLSAVPKDADIVLVHDGARPFVAPRVIENVLCGVLEHGAAIPCVYPKATIRTKDQTLDRSLLYEVQTPQGFRKQLLLEAFEKAFSEGLTATDEASLVEYSGNKVCIVQGSYANIKVTTKEDLPRECRTGFGYDVHRLAAGRELWLGCVKIPYSHGLLGHSDADVIVHAIADSLLGAAALGDIGKHFPDSDDAYKGMPGAVLLSRVRELIQSEGFTICFIDATLACEQPKIAPYIEEMRSKSAAALNIDRSLVSIKATTQEGLGFVGRMEGMSATAVATLR
jgi:2-C-methyl-D-erythritol 4-phosphate cytidylyltransferase / 2-C-methyl-D-erythritol 2,4-cyclodiphosphate synthase